jgi:hypothetical protein
LPHESRRGRGAPEQWYAAGRAGIAGLTTIKRPDGAHLRVAFAIAQEADGSYIASLNAVPGSKSGADPAVHRRRCPRALASRRAATENSRRRTVCHSHSWTIPQVLRVEASATSAKDLVAGYLHPNRAVVERSADGQDADTPCGLCGPFA